MNEIITNNNPPCKSCGSSKVRKYGLYKDVQRYFCNDCGSKFKDDDTTFHMKTPANQVTSALNMYYEGMSIKGIRRNLQQEHGNMPSTATIYEWIQKYTQYATDSIKGHKPRGSLRLEPTKVGRPRKRVRISPKMPKLSDVPKGLE